MKIAIVTPGRSHLIRCGEQLLRHGHEVAFYTMVPRRRCEKFGMPKRNVISFFVWAALPMLLYRNLPMPRMLREYIYQFVEWMIDRLAAFTLRPCDVFIGISGCVRRSAAVARERYHARIFIDRGCKHILEQDRILAECPGAQRVFHRDIPIELWEYRYADKIILPSQHSLLSFLKHGVPREKLFVDAYGVDLNFFHPTPYPRGEVVYDIISVGAWSYQKGCDVLIEACQKKGWSLLHVGPIADLPFPSEAQFTHIQPVSEAKLVDYYAEAKVLALPSRQDGFGLVLHQAAACGLPLVYTADTGGPDLKRLLNDPPYLIEARDLSVGSLSEAIAEALRLSDCQRGQPLRDYAKDNILNITWDAYGDRYQQLFG